ncbi:MAG TPA: Ig-like domain-containing protein [Gemmatimonadaceae bacterium]|nr:Ig-like domain-containing protein [Gemmatimonadaceae bacterium]
MLRRKDQIGKHFRPRVRRVESNEATRNVRPLPAGWRRAAVLAVLALTVACRDETPISPPAPSPVGAVVSVVVSAPRQALSPGDSVRFTAQAFDAQGRVLPTAQVTWRSSNPAIATIDSRGVATAVAVGTTTITATSSGQSGSTELFVSMTQLCECTRIIDSTATELVSRNDSTGIYVFRVRGGGASQQPAIDSGSIIVGAEDGGFLRRVDRVTRSSDMVTLETSFAYLEEAVQDGAFATTSAIDGATVGSEAGMTRWGNWTTTYVAPELAASANDLCCSLNGLSLKWTPLSLPIGPASAKASGEFTVKEGDIDFLPRLEVGANFSRFQLQSFRAVFHGGLGLNLEAYEMKLTLEGTTNKIALKKESKRFITKQKPFATFIGPMPVVGIITLTISLQATPTVSTSAVFGGKFKTGFGFHGGMAWARSAGWSSISGSSRYFEATAPTFQGVEGSASVKIAVVPELSVQFYGVAGPKVDVEPYAEAAASAGASFASGTPTGLDWETRISLGLNVNIGAKISLLGRLDLGEASFAIPIIKPYKLVRGFSDGPLTVHTVVTGEDRPASLSVQLRPAFVDTAPPFGRDLATSSQDVTITANDSMVLHDIRSGTSYAHTVRPVRLAGNCTFGPPLNSPVQSTPFAARADTVAISSDAFMALGGTPAVDTLRIDCIPLGSLLVRTVTTGPDATSRSQLALERLDTSGAGKGTPPLMLDIPGGDAPPDTVIGALIPVNPANGSSGQYLATLDPGRKNCAVARPASHQAVILSGDTISTTFRIRCVALGHARTRTSTIDPDAAAPSDPVVYRLGVSDLDSTGSLVASHDASPDVADPTLGASAVATVNGLVPIYNASGASGRHDVRLTGAPNRCTAAGGFARAVTVFPGDTALADFVMQCVERLQVDTRSTGPGMDSDGFVVIVENADGTADSVAIATTDTVGVAGVTPGIHTIRLGDVDGNCVAPASVQRDVSARDSTLVSFSVSCPGPPAPAGLRTTLVESARIDLAWTPAPGAAPAESYRLYRSTPGVPGSGIVVDAIPGLTYSDTGLPGFTPFLYQVAAVDANGLVGPRSAALLVRTLDGSPPSAPGALTAIPVSGFVISLKWGAATDPESGIAQYRVFRDGVLIDSTTATSYLSGGLTPMTAYTYEVMAVNGEGLDGPLSAPAAATTLDATPPTSPTGLTATAAGTARIDLSWSAAADPESGVARYLVYRGGGLIGATVSTAFADSGLTPATAYTYAVSAVNGSEVEGPRSAPATATTDAPPVATGDLTVVVQTTGDDIPPAGFQLRLSATGFQLDRPAAPDGTLLYSELVAQPYTLLLIDPSGRCAPVDGQNPRTVTVAAGSMTTITLSILCQ